MPNTLAISSRIVEDLYREALALSDDVRASFALSDQLERPQRAAIKTGDRRADPARLAYSREGLRTTTRMMHAIAWLLNHRAYFMAQMSEAQLRRHGRLSPDLLASVQADTPLLAPDIARLVERTCSFYERLLRLDEDWRLSQPETAPASAIERLRQRIENRLAS
ncbi:DUF1465 family protein [Novosphingobium sp. 1949]|uniref:DUF1465 family protein n=1 Tax=Novosphingobium organovorum TaxID=2930092 RepID=A0ABT0BH06_9SPHN|nr:DUF1465 family protein [Novosphingobium organovorum]MCJ2184066.1 DUF1465 family protein [Novosphingobium organovorum]